MLYPALPRLDHPEWQGALWIGSIDLTLDLPASIPLADADGYTRARLLARNGLDPVGFVELAIDNGVVDAAELRASAAQLPPAANAAPRAPLSSPPPVTIVICTRDRVEHLRGALASVLAVDYPDVEVVVVDNASTTGDTIAYVESIDDPRVRIVREPAPGLSRARNTGIRAARHDLVAFTDDDVAVDPSWLTALVRGFGRADKVTCVSGIVPSGEIRTQAQAYFDRRVGWASSVTPRIYDLAEPPADVPLFPFQVGMYGTGANFAVRRSRMFDLGGFDESLGVGSPTNGGEDLDIFFRILMAGDQLVYEPGAIVWHRHRADSDALAIQARGYGLGLGAWLATVATDRRAATLAAKVAFRKAGSAARLSLRMSKVASPPSDLADDLPAGIGRMELLSIFKGPMALRRSRRGGRARRPLTGVNRDARPT
ncbi:glycosyltransferase family 2 protein [Rhodococcus sp. 06-235-1A]|uniref:glycosyltransferase family 2 protein n=1 Tax=Rhodococcus sp. 06-235-1A TaxID=2022508 RepID=UPI00211AD36C|nr:glycosyltransferase [Rhodococcus sp. 06-235-1A]